MNPRHQCSIILDGERCSNVVDCVHQILCLKCIEKYANENHSSIETELLKRRIWDYKCFRCILQGDEKLEFSLIDEEYMCDCGIKAVEIGKMDERDNCAFPIEEIDDEALKTHWIIKKYYQGVNYVKKQREIMPHVFAGDDVSILVMSEEREFIICYAGKFYPVRVEEPI
jgi:hypothetical protein